MSGRSPRKRCAPATKAVRVDGKRAGELNYNVRLNRTAGIALNQGVPAASDVEGVTSSPALSALSYVIMLAGFLTLGVSLYMVVRNYSDLPFFDGWAEVEIAANGGNPLSPAWLWHQHNEHRLVLPKLFLAADLELFQCRQTFLLVSIFVIQFLHWGLLSWSMWALGLWRGALWRTGAGLAAFCLFCPSQWQNFTWGFQVCFVLPQLLATASIVALLLYWMQSQREAESSPSLKFLVLSVLAALGASYSLASGSLLWPLLVLTAAYLRLRRAALLTLAVTGAVSTGLYLVHYVRPQQHANPLSSLRAPFTLMRYCAVYFVSSWQHRNMHPRETILLVALLILMAALTPTLWHLRMSRPFVVELIFVMLFCAATTLITATGRLNLGVEQARASRYQTVALVFWCCLGLLWLGAVYARPRVRAAFLVAQLCILTIFIRAALTVRYPLIEAGERAFAQKVVAASLITGVHDPTTLRKTFPRMDMLLKAADYMKANHLSIFADLSSELGEPLTSLFPLAGPGECVGFLQGGRPVQEVTGPGLFVAGWAWDVKHHKPGSQIVVTTNGIVSGLGATGAWLPDARRMYHGINSSYIGFFAVLPQPPPGALVNVYTIVDGKPSTACYLDGWRQAGAQDSSVHRM